MSTSDLTVTLVGWVGTEPRHYTGTGVTPFTSFRMANTRRYFDRAQSTWTDGRTEWFTVKVWRQTALNVATSLRKGDPVLVHGRLSTEQWDAADGPRTSLVLEALAIGPDLTYGRASFARTVHVGGAAGTPGDAGDPTGPGGVTDPAGPSDGDPVGGDGDGGPGAGADAGPDDPWATGEPARPELPLAVDAGGDVTGPAGAAGTGAQPDRDADPDDPDPDPGPAARVAARTTRTGRGRAVDVAAV